MPPLWVAPISITLSRCLLLRSPISFWLFLRHASSSVSLSLFLIYEFQDGSSSSLLRLHYLQTDNLSVWKPAGLRDPFSVWRCELVYLICSELPLLQRRVSVCLRCVCVTLVVFKLRFRSPWQAPMLGSQGVCVIAISLYFPCCPVTSPPQQSCSEGAASMLEKKETAHLFCTFDMGHILQQTSCNICCAWFFSSFFSTSKYAHTPLQ